MATDLISSTANRVETDQALDSLSDLRAVLLSVPELRRLVVAAGIRALGATKSYYDKNAKEMVHEPDCASQMKAAIFLAAYSDGLPAKTNVNLNLGNGKGGDGMPIESALRRSPALIEALKKEIRRAEGAPGEILADSPAGSKALDLE